MKNLVIVGGVEAKPSWIRLYTVIAGDAIFQSLIVPFYFFNSSTACNNVKILFV